MQKLLISTCCSVILSIVLFSCLAQSAPTNAQEYDSIRDLYELLLQKEAMEEIAQPQHLMVRKSNRSPQLRLRFGKKSDPYFQGQAHYGPHPLRLLDELAAGEN